MNAFKWCPNCNEEGFVNKTHKDERNISYIGTDGYGQMVKFSPCNCGSDYGWLYLHSYDIEEGDEVELENYIKHRIGYYHREVNGSKFK